ncbi:MAG: hypothetical protein M3040_10955 [Bacteroidota bacterium]|nr:hypothetical protein [Bacteroidota bacterium]
MFDDMTSSAQYEALKFAVQQLNATIDPSFLQGGLENYVEFRIMRPFLKRKLLYKIDQSIDEKIKVEIRRAIREEAAKLGIEVLTIDSTKGS